MIFVDTSAFFALSYTEDPNQASARGTLERLLETQEELVTTNYILTECFALIQRRFGFQTVRAFYRDIYKLCRILWVSQSQHERSAKAFVQQTSPRYSFVDCVSFEIMKANGVRRFFAFDDDFQKAGFEPA